MHDQVIPCMMRLKEHSYFWLIRLFDMLGKRAIRCRDGQAGRGVFEDVVDGRCLYTCVFRQAVRHPGALDSANMLSTYPPLIALYTCWEPLMYPAFSICSSPPPLHSILAKGFMSPKSDVPFTERPILCSFFYKSCTPRTLASLLLVARYHDGSKRHKGNKIY